MAPITKTAWKKAASHSVTLLSGTEVEIVLPNLPALIKAGQVPNPLVDAAIGALEATEVTREMIEQQADFYAWLVATTVKVPEVAVEDVASLPAEDVQMVAEFALRERDIDALGRHMSGLEKVADFRRFRGLDSRDTSGSGL